MSKILERITAKEKELSESKESLRVAMMTAIENTKQDINADLQSLLTKTEKNMSEFQERTVNTFQSRLEKAEKTPTVIWIAILLPLVVAVISVAMNWVLVERVSKMEKTQKELIRTVNLVYWANEKQVEKYKKEQQKQAKK